MNQALHLWHAVIPTLAIACISLVSFRARADFQGWIAGNAYVWNMNGNYCPTSANCAGTRYPQSQYNTWQPLRNMKVSLQLTDGTIFAQSATDDDGHYSLHWTATQSQSNTLARVVFYSQHKEDRFDILTTSGSVPTAVTDYYYLINSGVRNLGGAGIGNSVNPNHYFNTYWAAERVWREAFATVGVLYAYMTGVSIFGFDSNGVVVLVPDALGPCPTSCAAARDPAVLLDANAGLQPQARVMHELGHIASYYSHNWHIQNTTDYCYPGHGSNCTWGQATEEWGIVGFEEAYATLGANVTLWDTTAVNPTSCLTNYTCFDGNGMPLPNTNIEATSYPYATDNCVAGENRWPLSHMRFMWDVYDSHNDADGDTIQEGIDCFWCLWTNLYRYPEGTAANQTDEPWNSTYSYIDNYDGRGSLSYSANYNIQWKNIGTLRVDNCSPP